MKPLKVMADPGMKGLHPCHDSRFIVTQDAQVDPESVDEGEPGFRLESGAIIAKLTDCQDQASYARLFAASPELLEAAQEVDALIENLFNAVPWGKTFGLDIKALNEAPTKLKRAIARALACTPAH